MAITNSVLPIVQRFLSEAWPGSMVEADFSPRTEVLRAVLEQQTARLDFANLPDQVDAYILWLNDCDIDADDACANDCSFSGSVVDSYRKAVQIDQCAQTTFSVPIDSWRDNAFGEGEATAVQLLKTQKAHVEKIAAYIVSTMNSNAGTHTKTDRDFWDISVPTNAVHADAVDPRMFGRLRRLAEWQKFMMPYVITGSHLDQMLWEARTAAGNADGAGDARRIAELPAYSDIHNVDNVNGDTYSSYILNKGALAVVSKGYFGSAIETLAGNTQRFSVANRFYPNIIHDVEVLTSCDTGVWSRHYRVKTRFDVFLNPTGCTAGRTGILRVSDANS